MSETDQLPRPWLELFDVFSVTECTLKLRRNPRELPRAHRALERNWRLTLSPSHVV